MIKSGATYKPRDFPKPCQCHKRGCVMCSKVIGKKVEACR